MAFWIGERGVRLAPTPVFIPPDKVEVEVVVDAVALKVVDVGVAVEVVEVVVFEDEPPLAIKANTSPLVTCPCFPLGVKSRGFIAWSLMSLLTAGDARNSPLFDFPWIPCGGGVE
jgi:hypothetical protein